ncbi:MAG: hypothetical protein E5W19_33060, partial [Mesorhizobium sp.]
MSRELQGERLCYLQVEQHPESAGQEENQTGQNFGSGARQPHSLDPFNWSMIWVNASNNPATVKMIHIDVEP